MTVPLHVTCAQTALPRRILALAHRTFGMKSLQEHAAGRSRTCERRQEEPRRASLRA